MAITGYVLDTSAYSAYEKMHTGVAKYMNSPATAHVPLIVIGELRSGFAYGSKEAKNEDILRRFLNMPQVDVMELTERTTEIYGKLYAQLRSSGTPIGTNDMWIAALCLERDLTLLTLDTDFQNVDGLRCLDIT